jgi:hypothetical protein
MPAFFALSGTLVYEWFSDFAESAAIAANFVVSATILIPAAAIGSSFTRPLQLTEEKAAAIGLLFLGTLAAAAAGRLFYQMALSATKNDNGYVTMFFLLIPGITALISLALSRWVPTLTFVSGPGFVLGMACVSGALVILAFFSRRREIAPRRTASSEAWEID